MTFRVGQHVSRNGQVGEVTGVDLTPGMVDVRYGRLTKRHRKEELVPVQRALNNGSFRRPRRERLALRTQARRNAGMKHSPAAVQEAFSKIDEEIKKTRQFLEKNLQQRREYKLALFQARAAFEAVEAQAQKSVASAEERSKLRNEMNAVHKHYAEVSATARISKQLIGRLQALRKDPEAAVKYISRLVNSTSVHGEFFATKVKVPHEEQEREAIRVKKLPEKRSLRSRVATPEEQISRSGAAWFTLPDPARFIETRQGLQPELCGNPLDGTMYVIVLASKARYAPVTVTPGIWEAAHASRSTGSPIEILTSWASDKRGFGEAEAVGRGRDKDTGDVIPFTAEDVRGKSSTATTVTSTHRAPAATSRDTTAEARRRAQRAILQALLQATAPGGQVPNASSVEDLSRLLVDSLITIGAASPTAQRQAHVQAGAAELAAELNQSPYDGNFNAAAKVFLFLSHMLNALSGTQTDADGARAFSPLTYRGPSALRELLQLRVDALEEADAQEEDRFAAQERARIEAEAYQEAPATSKRVARFAGAVREGGVRGERSRSSLWARQIPSDAFIHDLGTGGFVYYQFPRSASVSEEKFIGGFSPNYNAASGKRKNPFFSWQRLTRPLDTGSTNKATVRVETPLLAASEADAAVRKMLRSGTRLNILRRAGPWIEVELAGGSGMVGWVSAGDATLRKSDTFSSPPLCVSQENTEVIDAAREAKKRIGEMRARVRALHRAVTEKAHNPEHALKWLLKDGADALRATAWFGNWCQEASDAARRLRPGQMAELPEMQVFDAVRDVLPVTSIAERITSTPFSLAGKHERRRVRRAGIDKPQPDPGSSPIAFVGLPFEAFVASVNAYLFEKNSGGPTPVSDNFPSDAYRELRKLTKQAEAAPQDAELAQARSSARDEIQLREIAGSIVLKMAASGALRADSGESLREAAEQARVDILQAARSVVIPDALYLERDAIQHKLAESGLKEEIRKRLSTQLPALREDLSRREVVRALFILYFSLGGASLERQLSSASDVLDVVLRNAGTFPHTSYATTAAAREQRKAVISTATAKAAGDLTGGLEQLEAERAFSILGATAGVGLGRVNMYYTFNPILFAIARERWGAGGPWVPAAAPGRAEARTKEARIEAQEALEDVDAVGRYGYALKLFYENALSRQDLYEAQQELEAALRPGKFRDDILDRLAAAPAGSLNVEALTRHVEDLYPHVAQLEPGLGGRSRIRRWAQTFEENPDALYPSAAYFAADPITELSKLRQDAFEGVSRQRGGERVRRSEKDHMAALAHSSIPPYTRTSLVGEKDVERTYLRPGSAVAALEDIELDAARLLKDIKRRQDDIVAQLRAIGQE